MNFCSGWILGKIYYFCRNLWIVVYAVLPDDCSRRLTFYLAMEEHIARHLSVAEGVFFMWQVDPTVICGRHQDVAAEVDLDYCRENGIAVVRRKSGGGCVFADRSNIMFSCIIPAVDVAATFTGYTSAVAATLRGLGLDASATTRNDILIGSRKVSGNAFYRLGASSIVHGTMLYATDFTHITRAITPSRAKLESKGVKSVESRITTIAEHLNISLEDFKARCRQSLCGDAELRLTAADIPAIEELERDYYRDGWLMRNPRNPRRATRPSRHIEGVGEILPMLTLLPDGRIDSLELSGDFFSPATDPADILRRLHGVECNATSVAEALAGVDVADCVAGLTNEKLVTLIFQ